MFTQREFLFLEDLLHMEELQAKKFQSYAQQAQDPEIAQLLSSAAHRHTQHFEALLDQVKRQQQTHPPTSQKAWGNQQQPSMTHSSGWGFRG